MSDIESIYERYSRQGELMRKIFSALSFLPVSNDMKKNGFYKSTLFALKKALFLLKVVLMVAYSALIFFRYGKSWLSRRKCWREMEQMEYSVVLAFYMYIPLLEFVNWRVKTSWLGHFRRIRKFLHDVKGNVRFEDKGGKSIENYAKLWMLFCLTASCNIVLLALHAVTFEDSPESLIPLIRHLVPEGWRSLDGCKVVVPAMAFTCQMYILTNLVSMAALICFTFLTCLPAVNVVLGSIRKGRGESGYAEDRLRLHVKLYREATLLLETLGESYGVAVGLVQGNVLVCTVIAVYCVMRIGGIVGLTYGCMGMATLIVFLACLRMISESHERSVQLLKSWEGESGKVSRVVGRSLKSLRPLKFSVGGLYFLDKMIVFTMFQITLDSSISVLIGAIRV